MFNIINVTFLFLILLVLLIIYFLQLYQPIQSPTITQINPRKKREATAPIINHKDEDLEEIDKDFNPVELKTKDPYLFQPPRTPPPSYNEFWT